MLCKVLEENNTEYISIVLAIAENGFYSKILILDYKKEKIIMKPIYKTLPSLKRKIFIVENDISGWSNKKARIKSKIFKQNVNIRGYDWIIDKVESMNFDEEDVKKAKALDDKTHFSEWNYINNKNDIDSLLEASWGFHDSYIYSMNYINNSFVNQESYGYTNLQVIFKGCWECTIELVFEDVALIHFPFDSNTSFELYEGSILIHDGYVYFVDAEIDDVSKIEDSFICFKSRALKWKIITDKD